MDLLSNEDQKRKWNERTIGSEWGWTARLLTGVWSSGDRVCRSFVHLPNTVSLSAETLRKVGDGYRAEECRQACIDSTDFVCVAAQMHLPSTCFVIGFRLRNDYISIHYNRVCEHGQCALHRITQAWAWITRDEGRVPHNLEWGGR